MQRPFSSKRALTRKPFRKALVCAGALILISAALGLHSYFDSPPSEDGIVESAIQLTLMP